MSQHEAVLGLIKRRNFDINLTTGGPKKSEAVEQRAPSASQAVAMPSLPRPMPSLTIKPFLPSFLHKFFTS